MANFKSIAKGLEVAANIVTLLTVAVGTGKGIHQGIKERKKTKECDKKTQGADNSEPVESEDQNEESNK